MPFSRTHLTEVAQLLRAAARTEIMPRFRRLPPTGTRQKTGPLDLVTDADEAAEAFIAKGLRHLFPGCLVVGEEETTRQPDLLGQLAAAPLAFTVDPIDGTANYAAGLPLFGVMVAVLQSGTVTGAVILDPVVDSYSAALLDEGAWEQACDGTITPLRVAKPGPVETLTGAISWRFLPPELKARVLGALPRLASVWDHRCAAHEYRALAAGHAHVVLFHRLMPWDHLPGVLIHREAGGHAAHFDGFPYRPGQLEGGLICAPDAASWTALRDTLLGVA